MDIYEVIKKLVGEIDPVGDTGTDNARLDNSGPYLKRG